MRRIYVQLTADELERLRRLAAAHRRHPSAEAGVLLAAALNELEREQTEQEAGDAA